MAVCLVLGELLTKEVGMAILPALGTILLLPGSLAQL